MAPERVSQLGCANADAIEPSGRDRPGLQFLAVELEDPPAHGSLLSRRDGAAVTRRMIRECGRWNSTASSPKSLSSVTNTRRSRCAYNRISSSPDRWAIRPPRCYRGRAREGRATRRHGGGVSLLGHSPTARTVHAEDVLDWQATPANDGFAAKDAWHHCDRPQQLVFIHGDPPTAPALEVRPKTQGTSITWGSDSFWE